MEPLRPITGWLVPARVPVYVRAMLGFSLSKIVVLSAIAAAVWYGFKFVGRLEKRRKEDLAAYRKPEPADIKGVGEMIKCPKCDAFVAASGAMNCGRSNCLY